MDEWMDQWWKLMSTVLASVGSFGCGIGLPPVLCDKLQYSTLGTML